MDFIVRFVKVICSYSIIGGGVGGLALAIFLAQGGHKVTLIERNDGSYQTRSTGGIAMFNNSTSILKRRDLWDRVSQVVDTGIYTSIFRYTGELIAKDKKPLPHSFVHRGDLLNVLSEMASDLKVDVAGLRKIIDFNVRQFGMADGEEQQKRDAELLSMKIEGEMEHAPGCAGAWLENYDAAAETRKMWHSRHLSNHTEVRKAAL